MTLRSVCPNCHHSSCRCAPRPGLGVPPESPRAGALALDVRSQLSDAEILVAELDADAARIAELTAALTAVLALVDTKAYMKPEQQLALMQARRVLG